MNPSSSKDWSNPPPPGTEYSDGELEPLAISPSRTTDYIPRAIDRIDPYLKSPEYIAYERKIVLEEPRHRSSRSASRGRYKRRKSRSRSRSRHRHRRSRSRSRRRRRHYSSSRSRSRSKSRSRTRDKHRERRHKRSRSRRSHKSKSKRSRSPRVKDDLRSKDPHRRRDEEDDDEDDDEETEPVKENAFKNDGSFLEMFKKMQEEKKEEKADTSEIKKPLLPPAFGKRRGGKVLKTGLVEKARMENDDEDESAQDAWSVYMKEVRRYKEACCDDDSKTRPLVK